MKKTLLIFTAGVLLTGCGIAEPVSDIQTENETAAEAVTVPFTDPDAAATYWFVCKEAGRERFQPLFAALERMGEAGGT